MTIDGSGMTGGAGPGFTLGSGGTGTLTVDDASINITANPFGGGFTIGTADGVGTATFENGADVLITGSSGGSGFNLGRTTAASQGTLNVKSGATLTLNSTTGGGGFTIGDAGTGRMNVSGAGTAVVLDGLTATANPFTTVGSQATGDGTLTIENGATFTTHRSGGSSATCCMTIGRLGHGALRILSGGKLVINDSSDATNFRLTFGGNSTSGTGGTFDGLISGVGSELTLTGKDAAFVLGRASGGSGTVTVDGGATVNADLFGVGLVTGSNANMTVSGSGTRINLVGDPDGARGGGFSVGAGGTGTMTVTSGAIIAIDGTATSQLTGVTWWRLLDGGCRRHGKPHSVGDRLKDQHGREHDAAVDRRRPECRDGALGRDGPDRIGRASAPRSRRGGVGGPESWEHGDADGDGDGVGARRGGVSGDWARSG